MGKTILRRVFQAALGATAAFVAQVMSFYEHQLRWFPDECFVGHPRLWLAGVRSSLEMRVALDGSGCFLVTFAVLGAAIPARVELRGLLLGAALVLAALLAPVALTLNHWQWSVEGDTVACRPQVPGYPR